MNPRRPSGSAQVGRSIVNLPAIVGGLLSEQRSLFQRLFHVSESLGTLRPPDSMHAWIVEQFGSVEAVERQVIAKTTNLITMEGTLFNKLRASRPIESELPESTRALIQGTLGDPFCAPLEGTPEDTFGRVRGRHSVTASNIAKYDGFHGLVVFDEHDPLCFDEDSISDAIDVALEWGHRVLQVDPAARYLFILWNCLWKSGASILHGHAQMTSTRAMHYAKIEALRRQALAYRAAHGSNYFDDLVLAHRSVGLVTDIGDTAVLCNLTPVKEKEVLLVAPFLTPDLRRAIAHVLDRFVHKLGVTSFNLAMDMPPLAAVPEDWDGFPHLVRIVDRGDPMNQTADVGAMELYASSVVSSDPFQVAEALAT